MIDLYHVMVHKSPLFFSWLECYEKTHFPSFSLALMRCHVDWTVSYAIFSSLSDIAIFTILHKVHATLHTFHLRCHWRSSTSNANIKRFEYTSHMLSAIFHFEWNAFVERGLQFTVLFALHTTHIVIENIE